MNDSGRKSGQHSVSDTASLSAFVNAQEGMCVIWLQPSGHAMCRRIYEPDIAGVRPTYNLQDKRDRLRIGFAQMRHVIRW